MKAYAGVVAPVLVNRGTATAKVAVMLRVKIRVHARCREPQFRNVVAYAACLSRRMSRRWAKLDKEETTVTQSSG